MDPIADIAARRNTQRGPRKSPDRPVHRRWLDVDGHPFFTRYCADPHTRRPVVLVHGLIVSSLYMVPLATKLGADFRTFAPDLPAIGYTPGPRGGQRVEDFADHLADWIRAADLDEPPVLIGNSMGCQIATDLAVRHPQLCAGLVLQGPTTDPARRRLLYLLADWMAAMPLEAPSQSIVMLHDAILSGPDRWFGIVTMMLRDRIEDRLPHVPHPTMVLRGTRDPIAREGWIRRVEKLLPDAVSRRIPGAAHTANYSAPLEMSRICRPFIRECFGAGRRPSRTDRRQPPTPRGSTSRGGPPRH